MAYDKISEVSRLPPLGDTMTLEEKLDQLSVEELRALAASAIVAADLANQNFVLRGGVVRALPRSLWTRTT